MQSVLPPGSTEPEVHENVNNLEANKHVTNPDEVLTKVLSKKKVL